MNYGSGEGFADGEIVRCPGPAIIWTTTWVFGEGR